MPVHHPANGRGENVHVLIVEDDEAVRNSLRLLLKVESYLVTAVASYAEALQHARDTNRVDLIISDYRLGGSENGAQVIGALREALGKSLPAVLLTGDTSSAAKNLVCDRYFRITNKPFRADDLLALLEELVDD